jgi:protein-disulfide isomerase
MGSAVRLPLLRTALALILAYLAPAMAGPVPVYHEFVEGNPKAKVTVIEYASLTCPHCARFYVDAFPILKREYIDTGRIKFIFRDLPTPPRDLALAAAVLARCAPDDHGFALIGMLYQNQLAWEQSPEDGLRHYAGLVGMSKDDFDSCLHNEPILKAMQESVQTAATLYHVNSTPTFIIGDDHVEGETYPPLKAAIDKALKEAK